MGDLSYSVVVVDNGSTDGTWTCSRRAPTVGFRSTNDGYAAGMNRACTLPRARRRILILNPDALLDAGAVPAMLAVLRQAGGGRRRSSGARRGRQPFTHPAARPHDGPRRRPELHRLARFTERIEDPREYVTEHEVEWAVGAILLVDAGCYATLGGMDESYFLYSEETDFSLRAKDAGWTTVYTPDAARCTSAAVPARARPPTR